MTDASVRTPQAPANSDGDGTPLLELVDVGKHFAGITAITGASLALYPGRVMGLVGNNGAGKSTLVRIVSGVQQPDEGHVAWQGHPVRLRNPRQARALGIDTVFQELALADDLDATANIFLNREISRGWGPFRVTSTRRMRREASALFEKFAIQVPATGTEVRQMSGGQRQGVAIARALLGGSKVLLLDEPTAALGVEESSHVEDLVLRLREHGVAILLVSHSVDQLLKLCDELCVLRRGRMVGVYSRRDLTPSDVVSLIVGADAG
jgi:ABC-type sugar transport system ATPase subunit